MTLNRIAIRLGKLEAAAGRRDDWAERDAAFRRALDACPEALALEQDLLAACRQHNVDLLGLLEHPDPAIGHAAADLAGRMLEAISLHQQREGA
jgi:hypothetical protein